MATLRQQVCVVVLFLVATVKIVNSLQCYTCTSGPDEICDDNFSRHAHQAVQVITCENSPWLNIPGAGPNSHCAKTKKDVNRNELSGNLRDYVFRGCVPENYCRLVNSRVTECEICDENLCNSSSVVAPSCVIALIMLVCKILAI